MGYNCVSNCIHSGDIDVIAAIGDRITAGTGANALTLLEMFIENRGLSFSIGGLLWPFNRNNIPKLMHFISVLGYSNFRTHLTLPNILKEFNPRLVGSVQ